MPVYAKKVQSSNSRFQDRETVIAGGDGVARTPVPNDVVLCNGCNSNIHETDSKEGYLVYLGKRELKADQPYDIYCAKCLKDYFPKAIMEV